VKGAAALANDAGQEALELAAATVGRRADAEGEFRVEKAVVQAAYLLSPIADLF
jgi:hypothetical protein